MESANEFSSDLKKFGEIKKAYYARVIGKIDIDSSDELFAVVDDEKDTFIVDKAIYRPKSSYCTTEQPHPNAKGKDAKTKFEIVFYDAKSNTSVVKCYPLTGRTHQIRVHLKSIGHPIANDIKYGGVLFNDIHGFEFGTRHESSTHDEEVKDDTENLYTPKLIDGMCLKFWLHAYKYVFREKVYETHVPEWAKKEYKIDRVFESPTV